MDLRKIKDLVPQPTVDLKQLANHFEGKLVKETMEKDQYGTDCLYWEIDVNGLQFRQKYAPTHMGKLAEALELLHISDTSALIGKTMGFEKDTSQSRNAKEFPRWYPVAVLD